MKLYFDIEVCLFKISVSQAYNQTRTLDPDTLELGCPYRRHL